MTISSLAFAEYSMKIPMEVSQGGSLSNGSIKFVSGNSNVGGGSNTGGETTPEEPTNPAPEQPFNFADYNGVGVLDWTQAGGDFAANSFQSTLYSKVLLRGWGFHSVYLNGERQELADKYSKIVITTQSGTFDCMKSGDASVMWTDYNDGRGTIIETVFHCEVAGGVYNTTNTAVGQEIGIYFQ